MHPESLKSSYHIRCGGYGGIGYYLISDTYIALFSRFLACGAYEGHAILDFVAENRLLLQLTTVHSDTHGQSSAIFGLAHLLGTELMPRIRSWQNLHLFRPDTTSRYDHIDGLFTATVDRDMLRAALSIRAGKLLPSAILRRLATHSRWHDAGARRDRGHWSRRRSHARGARRHQPLPRRAPQPLRKRRTGPQ